MHLFMKKPADYVSVKRDATAEEVALIQLHGKSYKAAPVPPDIELGPLGWCYDWSMIQCATLEEKYRYVEGIALDPQTSKWELHAWLTDGTHAFDATWAVLKRGNRTYLKTKYIGIEMPIFDVLRFVRKTEYQGVIPNRDKDHSETLNRIIGG